MKSSSKVREELAQVLVGATIISIDPPDPGKSECLFKIVADKARHTYECHVHATDLGMWLSGVKEGTRTGGTLSYVSVHEVFEEMVTHLTSARFDDYLGDGSQIFKATDDVMSRMLGFRCEVTGREWWLSMKAVKLSPWSRDFVTTESRAAVAAHIGKFHEIPTPSTEV